MLQTRGGKVINPEGLEVNATFHCNMRCRSCSHLAPLYRRSAADPAAVHDTLATLAGSYHAAYVKILGGEPLLHPDLLAMIAAVRASQVSDTILICTNGTLLSRAPARLWQAVDALEISVYPSRPLAPGDLARFRALAAEHGTDLTVSYYGHFRVAYSERGTDSPDLVRDIFDTCKLAHFWLSHSVHGGWLYRCPQSIVLPEQLAGAGWDRTADGIEISGEPGFADRLAHFLNRTTPLRACRNCLGSVGQLHPHAEVARRAWREDQPTEGLIDREFLALARADIGIDDGCVDPVCPVPRAPA